MNKEIHIGDTVSIIITGNTKNPLCTKGVITRTIFSSDEEHFYQSMYIIDIPDRRPVGIYHSEIVIDESGELYYAKEVE